MGLPERVNARASRALSRRTGGALSWDEYQSYFDFGGPGAPLLQTTMGSLDREKVAASAVAAYKASGPVFALVMARMQVFSQVRFQWTRFSGSLPGDLFGTPELGVLEKPWPNGTTADLLARMEMHNSLAGNAYVRRTRVDQLNVLRPDLVTIILGSQENEADPALAADTEVAGYFYTPAGGRPQIFLPDEIAHFAPVPDPWFHFLGQSWITPVLRELQGDMAATEHKWAFFQNSATPNLAVKFDPALTIDKVRAFKELMEEEHRGVRNAFRTLYLGGGADPTTVGSSFKDMDYAVIQGRAESRLASAAGVPPSWVGFAEGLQGSSLNAGNFDSARRRFADGTLVHLWTNAAASLGSILTPPDQFSQLWYDSRVPFMREDAGDLAKIQAQQAQTIAALVREGFTPESVKLAVANNDMNLLEHTGMLSVQLWEPGAESSAHPEPGAESPSVPAGVPAGPPAPAGQPAVVNGAANGATPALHAGGAANGKPVSSANGKAVPARSIRAMNGYPDGEQSPQPGMISLDLPDGTIDPLPGGVTDHHVTVVYLGPDVDDTAFTQACARALQAATDAPGPLAGTVDGLGTFPPSDASDGKTPVYADADLPGAQALRDALADLSQSEFTDWVPHVTLCYAGPDDELPPPVPSTPVTVSHLSVHRGDDVMRFPLGGAAAASGANGKVPAHAG